MFSIEAGAGCTRHVALNLISNLGSREASFSPLSNHNGALAIHDTLCSAISCGTNIARQEGKVANALAYI